MKQCLEHRKCNYTYLNKFYIYTGQIIRVKNALIAFNVYGTKSVVLSFIKLLNISMLKKCFENILLKNIKIVIYKYARKELGQ